MTSTWNTRDCRVALPSEYPYDGLAFHGWEEDWFTRIWMMRRSTVPDRTVPMF